MNERLCPKCGAYWGCDCRIEELKMPLDDRCDHDWIEAIGVDIDLDDEVTFGVGSPKVMVCRLCGIFAVSVEAR